MLSRVFEPEVMDSPAEAAAYDRMDHAQVNRRFVADLRRFAGDDALQAQILDIGTGTARIPALLCQQLANCQVWAIDLSGSMIHLGRQRLDKLGLAPRIGVALADAKRLPYADQQFAATISNSCLHHVTDPVTVLAEAVRVTAAGGVLFFRDLLRPPDDAAVRRLVRTYAGGEPEREQKLFEDSLRASLTLSEVRGVVARLDYAEASVQTSSDRHWTWATRIPDPAPHTPYPTPTITSDPP